MRAFLYWGCNPEYSDHSPLISQHFQKLMYHVYRLKTLYACVYVCIYIYIAYSLYHLYSQHINISANLVPSKWYGVYITEKKFVDIVYTLYLHVFFPIKMASWCNRNCHHLGNPTFSGAGFIIVAEAWNGHWIWQRKRSLKEHLWTATRVI